MSTHRDIKPARSKVTRPVTGRNVIAVIGIDRYRHWRSLTNAVSDARGARSLFHQLGFCELVPPLLDDGATGAAMRALVADDLRALSADDSLIVFFAGHGGSQLHEPGSTIKTGHLIPVDGEPDKVSTWIDLESWLRHVSLLPPRHILVILDACYSGIALDPEIKWRDATSAPRTMLATLQARYSRRVITSALDDERALDGGPIPGHSLFTGCLIEALSGGLAGSGGVITGSELALWLQQRVRSYPGAQQTPDFGTFGLDRRGEITIPLLHADTIPSAPPHATAVVAPAEAPPSSKPVTARPPSGIVAKARRALREERETLLIVLPLLLLAIVGLLAKSC